MLANNGVPRTWQAGEAACLRGRRSGSLDGIGAQGLSLSHPRTLLCLGQYVGLEGLADRLPGKYTGEFTELLLVITAVLTRLYIVFRFPQGDEDELFALGVRQCEQALESLLRLGVRCYGILGNVNCLRQLTRL